MTTSSNLASRITAGLGAALGPLSLLRSLRGDGFIALQEGVVPDGRLPEGTNIRTFWVHDGKVGLIAYGPVDEAQELLNAVQPADAEVLFKAYNFAGQQAAQLYIYTKGTAEPTVIDVSDMPGYTVVFNNDYMPQALVTTADGELVARP
ncbi:MAG: hypothetical protein EXS55_01890 [Candidatus Magasanikbacteria bacterium]|nr:hypothetical protein [Candidatus Magasanikbacteria bacterium]